MIKQEDRNFIRQGTPNDWITSLFKNKDINNNIVSKFLIKEMFDKIKFWVKIIYNFMTINLMTGSSDLIITLIN